MSCLGLTVIIPMVAIDSLADTGEAGVTLPLCLGSFCYLLAGVPVIQGSILTFLAWYGNRNIPGGCEMEI